MSCTWTCACMQEEVVLEDPCQACHVVPRTCVLFTTSLSTSVTPLPGPDACNTLKDNRHVVPLSALLICLLKLTHTPLTSNFMQALLITHPCSPCTPSPHLHALTDLHVQGATLNGPGTVSCR